MDLLVRARGHLANLKPGSHVVPDSRIYFGNRQLAESSQVIFKAMYRALMAYEPLPYASKLVLLRTKVPTLFRDRDPQMGWQALAGSVELHLISGSHGRCMDDEYLPGLAALIERSIEAAARVQTVPAER
jgi:hypothetical protein